MTLHLHAPVREACLRCLIECVLTEGKSRDLTFTQLHDYGCTLDDTELPHHISSPQQIEALHGSVATMLEKLPKPSIVTIARYVMDYW